MFRIPFIFLISLLAINPSYTHAQTTSAELDASKDLALNYLLDKDAITTTIINYGLTFDSLDWEMHRSVFTDEIEMDFSASIGDGLVKMSADDWVKGVKGFFNNLNATQHIAMPLEVVINGDSAYVKSMLHAQHYLPNHKGGSVQTMIGYYDNWLVRTENGWKIQKIVQHISWNQGNWYVFEKAAGLSE